ncbi:MAG: hypothetical protein RBS01_02655 [Candidatus Dojkabacteria bacterium]|jgi:hypothetical protein|nr:hypothetical protein [Candidatus Dojkabacteria bacterium]
MDRTDNSIHSDLFDSKEDILERYNELFVEENLDNTTFYLEIPTSDEPDVFRFIITPSGVVGVASLDKEHIWEVDLNSDEDKRFLTRLDKIVGQNNSTDDIKNLVREFRSDNETYFLRILPYSQKRASEILKCILDERLGRLE